ncbi:hypothetical protein EGR_07116 [Echinococcus granulosus]|uniref:Par3/HAL N-terminal domain-containing protein n=1 Tax=Echinococcus granulosus TaxID=6210 RepID=W6UAB7_ECHGR|nr:hypothetical protein EGR_07116 [Echinococcus granulosus]EUB58010.1 hypothetical protein EGR_07116 [Echinococcus granulosus]
MTILLAVNLKRKQLLKINPQKSRDTQNWFKERISKGGLSLVTKQIPRGSALPQGSDSALTGPVAMMDAEALSESMTEASEATSAVVHAVGEMEARLTRQRHPTATLFIVEALTLARDGGILDWDDRVRDVLDDRELYTVQFKVRRLCESKQLLLFSSVNIKNKLEALPPFNCPISYEKFWLKVTIFECINSPMFVLQ